jgi:hypothetical protein
MRLVVADTSPIRYLVRIGLSDLLRRLFERILVPVVVANELLEEFRRPAAIRINGVGGPRLKAPSVRTPPRDTPKPGLRAAKRGETFAGRSV